MGLLAGLFYFSSIAVMPALTAADDRTLVDAMQQMIDKIENPFFYLTLLGAPALASVALFQARRSGSPKTAGWIVAGLRLPCPGARPARTHGASGAAGARCRVVRPAAEEVMPRLESGRAPARPRPAPPGAR